MVSVTLEFDSQKMKHFSKGQLLNAVLMLLHLTS